MPTRSSVTSSTVSTFSGDSSQTRAPVDRFPRGRRHFHRAVCTRFDVRSGKHPDPPQIDPPCNWSLSPDGSQRAVIACRPNEGMIRLRSTSTGEARDMVVNGWNELMDINWAADGRGLLISWQNQASGSALLKVTPDGRASILLRSSNQIWHAIPSPDGRFLAIAEAGGTKNVWQIENF